MNLKFIIVFLGLILFFGRSKAISLEINKRLPNTSYCLLNAGKTVVTDGNVNSTGRIDANDLIFELSSPIKAIGYLPRQDDELDGTVLAYEIWISSDNVVWELIKQDDFPDIKIKQNEQVIQFENVLQTKYLKFVAKEVVGQYLTVAEVYFYE